MSYLGIYVLLGYLCLTWVFMSGYLCLACVFMSYLGIYVWVFMSVYLCLTLRLYVLGYTLFMTVLLLLEHAL